jgi:putative nucleotidyltransferase with HDIG domain
MGTDFRFLTTVADNRGSPTTALRPRVSLRQHPDLERRELGDELNLKRYLPHVLVATVVVAVLPIALVSVLQASGYLRSSAVSVALTVGLSLGMATAGSAFWARHSGSKDLVFGDLMIWAWIRRMRTERRLAAGKTLLNLGALRAGGTGLNSKRQAELLGRLASDLEARDSYTHGHSRRVTRHSCMIAKAMGLPRSQVAKVRAAASMHDVGKINTPRATLNKPGELTDEEFAIIKRHPVEGAEMLVEMRDPEITAMVQHHHERLDGKGYPDSLSGEDIPLGARIIAVADAFDAITSSRAYRPAAKHTKGIDILKKEAGSQLDPAAVGAFLSYYTGRKSVASWTLAGAVPQRLLQGLGDILRSAGSTPTLQSVSAFGATVVVGSSLASSAVVAQMRPDSRASGPASAAAVDAATGPLAPRSGSGSGPSGSEPSGTGSSDAPASGASPSPTKPESTAPGNSGSAPGQTKPGAGPAPGNSGSAPGQTKPGAGPASGNSGSAPGQTKPGAGPASGNSGSAPGQIKPRAGPAPGNSGSAPGRTDSPDGLSNLEQDPFAAAHLRRQLSQAQR